MCFLMPTNILEDIGNVGSQTIVNFKLMTLMHDDKSFDFQTI